MDHLTNLRQRHLLEKSSTIIRMVLGEKSKTKQNKKQKQNLRISQNAQLNDTCVFAGSFFLMFTEIFVNFSTMIFEACLHCLGNFLLTSRCCVKHS